MSKRDDHAHKKGPQISAEMEREITKKEERLRKREREQHRTLYIGVGIAIGLSVLLMILGIVWEFAVRPNRTVASVGDDRIVARDFWQRTRLEQNQLQNALLFYQLQEQQFGGQGFFTQQINQLSATLASPFALGQQTLDQMIEERIIAQEAAARGVTVSDAEIDEALREEVANSVGAVLAPAATATAEAGAAATAEATAWTPVPTPTVAATATVTATATAIPTPEPLPTPRVLTDTGYTEGLDLLASNIRDASGMSLEDYRAVVAARLLREKLAAEIAASDVVETEEQVRARHILLSEITPTPAPTAVPEGQPTPEPTPTATPLPEGAPTPTPTPAPRTREEAIALAEELRTRIEGGEDFAALAAEYSSDLSNAAEGGDLGWFGRGAMVAPFEEAAFALPVGQVSEPISTSFGIHLIQVDERDAERPKDEGTLEQERAQAFDQWLQERVAATPVERNDVEGNLPRQLQ
jgi:parvulin-like peptidyl-prolyl isomerase